MPTGFKRKSKKIPIPKDVATKYPPLTSEIQYQRTRKEQNALNRSRSKSMENRVAKVLGGRRVLLSGAASAYKGDVEVRFNNYPSGYIVECKLSAQNKEKEPYIILKFEWFPKIQQEAINMGSKFAVLIVNFLGNTRDFVFVRYDIIEKLIHKYETPLASHLQKLLTESHIIDARTNKSGKVVKGYTLQRSVIEAGMKKIDGVAGIRMIVPDGEYLILHIDTWAKATEHM
jgi:hypothetical protein